MLQIEFVDRGQVIGYLGPTSAVANPSAAVRFAPTVAEVKAQLDRAMAFLPNISPLPVSIHVKNAKE